MSRAVDVAGGTECKRRKEIVYSTLHTYVHRVVCAKSPLVHQVISKSENIRH